MTTNTDPGQTLANFAATLRFEDIPAPVLRRTEDLFLDWLGSALAGKGARPVESIARLTLQRSLLFEAPGAAVFRQRRLIS